MKSEIYKRYLEYELSDLAERRAQRGTKLLRGQRREEKVSGQKRRIPRIGHHMVYSDREWFQGNDASLRLTLALMAAEKYHQAKTRSDRGAKWNGCLLVAEHLLRAEPVKLPRFDFVDGQKVPCQSPCEPLRSWALRRVRGFRPKIKTETRSANRAKRPRHTTKLSGLSGARWTELEEETKEEEEALHRPPTEHELKVQHLAHIIHSRVDRFRQEVAAKKSRTNIDVDLDRLFFTRFSMFRFEAYRDAQWCAEIEPAYRKQLVDSEKQLGPDDRWTAMLTVNLARLLHEQRKYGEAVEIYELALERWEKATPISKEFRHAVLLAVRQALEDCKQERIKALRERFRI